MNGGHSQGIGKGGQHLQGNAGQPIQQDLRPKSGEQQQAAAAEHHQPCAQEHDPTAAETAAVHNGGKQGLQHKGDGGDDAQQQTGLRVAHTLCQQIAVGIGEEQTIAAPEAKLLQRITQLNFISHYLTFSKYQVSSRSATSP